MLKKTIILIVITMITIATVGCSKEQTNNEVINNGKSGTRDGSQRRGGTDKLERMQSGQGGRKDNYE